MSERFKVVIHRAKRKFEAGENQDTALHYEFPKEGKFGVKSVEEAAEKARKDFRENFPKDKLLLIQHLA